jgi:hypothetical protein
LCLLGANANHMHTEENMVICPLLLSCFFINERLDLSQLVQRRVRQGRLGRALLSLFLFVAWQLMVTEFGTDRTLSSSTSTPQVPRTGWEEVGVVSLTVLSKSGMEAVFTVKNELANLNKT